MLIQAAENQLWICISEAIVTVYQNWIDTVLQTADLNEKQKLQESHLELFMALKEGSMEACERAVDAHYDLIDKKLSNRQVLT